MSGLMLVGSHQKALTHLPEQKKTQNQELTQTGGTLNSLRYEIAPALPLLLLWCCFVPALPLLCLCFAFALLLLRLCFCVAFAFRMGGLP